MKILEFCVTRFHITKVFELLNCLPKVFEFTFEAAKIISFLSLQYDELIAQLQSRPNFQYADADEIIKESRRQLLNSSAKICFCLEDVGLLCASEVSVRFTDCSFLMFASVSFCLICFLL
jgi:hypothetical protein